MINANDADIGCLCAPKPLTAAAAVHENSCLEDSFHEPVFSGSRWSMSGSTSSSRETAQEDHALASQEVKSCFSSTSCLQQDLFMV